MAVPVTWVTTSPRDKASLDQALTLMADRYLAYKASVEAIANGYAGVVAADLLAMGYDASITTQLANAFGTINTHATDATVFALMGHFRNVSR